jgi:hypothetical protein
MLPALSILNTIKVLQARRSCCQCIDFSKTNNGYRYLPNHTTLRARTMLCPALAHLLLTRDAFVQQIPEPRREPSTRTLLSDSHWLSSLMLYQSRSFARLSRVSKRSFLESTRMGP